MKVTRFYSDPPIIAVNTNTEAAFSCCLEESDIPSIAGSKSVPAGDFLAKKSTGGHRPLGRSKILAPYVSGETVVIVECPQVFKIGDVLRYIAAPGVSRYTEETAIRAATAPLFGTVTGIDSLNQRQITTVTFASVAVGNIFTVSINGVPISYTATAASNQNVADGLKTAITKAQSGSSPLEEIRVTTPGGVLTLTTDQEGIIFTTAVTVAQGVAGTLGTAVADVSTAIGTLTITPQGGNASLAIGAKIGTIGDVVVGVLNNSISLYDGDQFIAPYSGGVVYIDALPYIDGDIQTQLPKLTFIP